jgi:two-component system response regulator YesN
VEDNAVYRYAVRTILDWPAHGFELAAEAVNGKQALQVLERERFDLILTDVSMPEMNGIDLIKAVKYSAPETVVVMLSSYDDFQFVKDSMKLGAEDYLLKHDLEPESLARILSQVRERLLSEENSRRQGGRESASSRPCRKEIQDALAYIREHFAEDISVTALSKVLNFSPNYLSNLFRNETGMRIFEYVNRLRMESAQRLLRDTESRVYEVAEKVGYQDVSYFCKVFKETTGTTVSEFRRNER